MNESFTAGGVLVVDDEPDLLTLYELTLLREGHEVETAATVADAWARLQERVFRLVISDMRLPDGSGLELMHRLQQAHRPEKVIVITAYGSAENAVEALRRAPSTTSPSRWTCGSSGPSWRARWVARRPSPRPGQAWRRPAPRWRVLSAVRRP